MVSVKINIELSPSRHEALSRAVKGICGVRSVEVIVAHNDCSSEDQREKGNFEGIWDKLTKPIEQLKANNDVILIEGFLYSHRINAKVVTEEDVDILGT